MKGFYGNYGGAFVPQILVNALNELDEAFEEFIKDKDYQDRLSFELKDFAGRPTPLTYAGNISSEYGFSLYLKREDLLHTGAHKINNTLGQAFLAKFMGKKRIIAETGAGQHGVATATAAARLNLECTIYMGKHDAIRQRINVERMKMLGAEVRIVDHGSCTLKDAINEALRDWITNVRTTHYLIGSVVGPYPFPKIVSHFQSVIGFEALEQCRALGFIPDVVVACVGGGSNAIGIFRAFIDKGCELIGVEAGGIGDDPGENAASLSFGKPGILHGAFSYFIYDENGQICDVHSISAGLDYPGVGPEHAYLKDINRVRYELCRDESALSAARILCLMEGILPALESSHALGYIFDNADYFKGKNILVNLSGRGDKDLGIILGGKDV